MVGYYFHSFGYYFYPFLYDIVIQPWNSATSLKQHASLIEMSHEKEMSGPTIRQLNKPTNSDIKTTAATNDCSQY